MTSDKHTPGPWKLTWHGNETYPFPFSLLTKDGEMWIARDVTVSSEANARLIAAAPDMLEALKNCLSLVKLAFRDTDATGNACIEQALNAIAKAET